MTSEGSDLAASAVGSVDGGKQQRSLPGAQCAADLFKPGHRLTRPAGKSDLFAAAPRQQRLDLVAKFRRHAHRPARRAREQPPRNRALEKVAARPQPQTPAGKIGGDIRHQFAVGRDDKA
jgi:hypothetical protein